MRHEVELEPSRAGFNSTAASDPGWCKLRAVQFQPGDRLDRFTLLRLLGPSGHGSVWMASDGLAPPKSYTLKLLKVKGANAATIERTRREARAVASVEHPSVVQVHVLVEDLRIGIMAMVMDYVDGISLADALGDPRLTIRMRQRALGHIVRALAAMHEQGVAHRNMKLENVILARDFWQAPHRPENVKLVDFGIALANEGDTGIGAAPYLAPEVVLGGEGHPATGDVFASGVLGWHLMSATHPTGLAPEATVADYARAYEAARQKGRVFAPSGYRGGWARVLEACTQIDPGKRPQDCLAVAAMLYAPGRVPVDSAPPQPSFTPRPMEAPLPPHGYPLPPDKPRTRVRLGYLGIGLTVVAGVVIITLWAIALLHR